MGGMDNYYSEDKGLTYQRMSVTSLTMDCFGLDHTRCKGHSARVPNCTCECHSITTPVSQAEKNEAIDELRKLT